MLYSVLSLSAEIAACKKRGCTYAQGYAQQVDIRAPSGVHFQIPYAEEHCTIGCEYDISKIA